MGHAIDNLTILGVGAQPHATGLFAVIGDHGVVRNISVTNATIPSTGGYGLLRASRRENHGLVTYAFTSGRISDANFSNHNRNADGGVVGLNDGTIERSSSSASVYALSAAGGWRAGITGLSSSRLRTARLPDAIALTAAPGDSSGAIRASCRSRMQLVLQRTPDSSFRTSRPALSTNRSQPTVFRWAQRWLLRWPWRWHRLLQFGCHP